MLRQHWGLREGMTDVDGMLLCRPRHVADPLARLAFRGGLSLGFQGGALDTASWTFGYFAQKVFLIIQPVTLEIRQLGVNSQVLRMSSCVSLKLSQLQFWLQPARPRVWFCPTYIHTAVNQVHCCSRAPASYKLYATRIKNRKPRCPVHPLIRLLTTHNRL